MVVCVCVSVRLCVCVCKVVCVCVTVERGLEAHVSLSDQRQNSPRLCRYLSKLLCSAWVTMEEPTHRLFPLPCHTHTHNLCLCISQRHTHLHIPTHTEIHNEL